MTIQAILLRYEPKRENLLRAIKDIQHELGSFGGESAELVAEYFELAPAAVYSAASFYDEIGKHPNPHVVVQVCDGANCRLKHAEAIIEAAQHYLAVRADDQHHPKARIERISCVGRCLDGPIVIVNGTIFEKLTPGRLADILRGYIG